MSRFIFIMLDGVGAGELPDAGDYGDAGSDTLGNLSRIIDLHLPNLRRLGLGNILPLIGVPPVETPLALTGRLAPLSAGKDTTVGHWEHMGLITREPFPTYPHGFPEELLLPFSARIGRGVLGNKPASGTAIIAELGEQHVAGGWPIVYTSADSVFQIAAHTDVVPLEQLYEWCEIARELLTGPHAVARVIARPFTGPVGGFSRTKDRRDFSLVPPQATYLDLLHDAGVPVVALGKISEVFVGRGVTTKLKVGSNEENLALLVDLLRNSSTRAQFAEGLLFTNLVDFDMVWGHRNDSEGFARGLEAVDRALPEILGLLGPEDRLVLTADHGVDPTTPSTDHSREYVPLLLYPRPVEAPAAGYEGYFSDTGATVHAHFLGGEAPLSGACITQLRPARGWRRYTPTQPPLSGSGPALPGRVGPQEAAEAADYLRSRLGPPPRWAVVLGSGLAHAFAGAGRQAAGWPNEGVLYDQVPHWRRGRVEGHLNRLSLANLAGEPVLLLRGRIHGYEGFDVSEVQLPVRTLAAWGVRGIILSSAAGAVASGLSAGDQVLVSEIIDLQQPVPATGPDRIPVGEPSLAANLTEWAGGRAGLMVGVQAAVTGPQYETATELDALRLLGADCVSMSLAAETRAAVDEGLLVAAVAVISNVGPPSHSEVLAGAAAAGERFAQTVAALVSHWRRKTV